MNFFFLIWKYRKYAIIIAAVFSVAVLWHFVRDTIEEKERLYSELKTANSTILKQQKLFNTTLEIERRTNDTVQNIKNLPENGNCRLPVGVVNILNGL